ncbi:hypothetical protein AB0L13_27895 [Saccharopolyspora shandongensis]
MGTALIAGFAAAVQSSRMLYSADVARASSRVGCNIRSIGPVR